MELLKPAQRDLSDLPVDIRQRVDKRLMRLEEEPFSHDSEKLVGTQRTRRVRVGKYRIVYYVIGKLIHVTAIGHRKEIYRSIF